MNTPVSSPNFMQSQMLQVIQDKIHLLKKIEELEDAHVVFSLIKIVLVQAVLTIYFVPPRPNTR